MNSSHDWFIWFVSFISFVWFVWFVWLDKTNLLNQINQRNVYFFCAASLAASVIASTMLPGSAMPLPAMS